MRVLIATWPASSHFFTMVPYAWALRAAGHDVRVASPPGVEDAVRRSGLPLVVTGPKADLSQAWRGFTPIPDGSDDRAEHERERALRAVRMFVLGNDAMVEDMLAFGHHWRPELVVFEPRMYAALRLARELGVPAVRALPGPDYTFSREEAERPVLDELWQRWGLTDPHPHGDLTLDPCPPSLQVPTTTRGHRLRYVPYAGPAELPLRPPPRGDRPRVFVTVGTLIARVAGHMEHVRALLAELAGLDAEIVLGIFSSQRDLLGELPPEVVVAQDMPLHLLLPDCDAIVHQGGAGTAMTSVACGVPQLTLPSVGDCFFNGGQIAASGAGLSVPWLDVTEGQVRALVSRLVTDPSYREAAQRLRAENEGQPPPVRAVDTLVGLVERAEAVAA